MIPSDEPAASIETNLLHRRGMLGTLGLTAAAWAASPSMGWAVASKKGALGAPRVTTPTAGSSRARSGAGGIQRPDVPEEWLARNSAAYDYLRYLAKLNFKCINPTQVIEAHAKKRGSVWNSIPPKAWWNRQGFNLRVIDRIAQMMNVHEVEVVSAYRNPAYNARCPGAKSGSYHQANVATDVVFPVRASQVTAYARNVRDRGLFKGGVGGYRGFTHIDTRGQNVNW